MLERRDARGAQQERKEGHSVVRTRKNLNVGLASDRHLLAERVGGPSHHDEPPHDIGATVDESIVTAILEPTGDSRSWKDALPPVRVIWRGGSVVVPRVALLDPLVVECVSGRAHGRQRNGSTLVFERKDIMVGEGLRNPL